MQTHSSFLVQCQCLPRADRRQPQFIFGIVQLTQQPSAQALRILQAPQPYVSVEQQSQSRSTSQSLSSPAGPTMSPRISISCFIDPIHFAAGSGDGGKTSATTFPRRVTRIGFFVFST